MTVQGNIEMTKYYDIAKRKRFNRFFMAAVIAVVFITTYMLILPAITIGNGLDFSSWINSATITIGSGSEQTLENGASYEVSSSDSLKFKLSYTVPGGELSSSTTDTIYYQLPFSINSDESGNVRDVNGDLAGTYTISQAGLITIVFNEDFVTKNEAGGEIQGDISFYSNVSKIITDSSETSADVKMNDSLKFTLYINQPAAEEQLLTITGKAGTATETTVPITYTISSESGTDGNTVAVTITNTNGELDGDVTVQKNGSTITATRTDTSNGFTYTLPALSAGEYYTISFTEKRTVEFTDSTLEIYVSSQATAKTGSSSVSATAGAKFSNKYISLDGSFSSGTLTWTITVNPDGKDIAGYTLTDEYLDQVLASSSNFKINWNPASNYTGSDVTVNTDASGNVTSITFNAKDGSTNTSSYTISYQVETLAAIGSNSFSNTAYLKKGTASYTATKTFASTYTPISSTADSKKVNDDDTLTLSWDVDIEPAALGSDWTYVIDTSDSTDEQYFTSDNIQDLQSQLGDDFEVYAVVNGTDVASTSISGDVGKQIKILKIKSTKQTSDTLSFTYETTADLSDVTDTQQYSIESYIEAYPDAGVSVGNSYTPSVVSTDTETEQSVDDVKENENTLTYNTSITVPSGTTGDVTIVDTIPEGTEADTITLGITEIPLEVGTHTYTVGWNQYYDGDVAEVEVTVTEDGQITIVIPETMYSGRSLPYSLKVKVTDLDSIPAGDSNTYSNKIVMTDSSGVEITTFGSSMTISNPVETLSKHGAQADEYVTYTVKIDPTDILGPGETTYTIKDHLYYNVYYPVWSFELVPGSLEIYKEDGTTPLSSYLYSYSYAETENGEATSYSGNSYRDLDIQVDYAKPIVLTYVYKITSATAVDTNSGSEPVVRPVYNQVTLVSETSTYEGEIIDVDAKNQKSSASASVKGFTIYKIDSEDAGTFLEGAKFQLFKYSTDTKQYESVASDDLITDSNGKLNLVVDADTAYYLVETYAPDGYDVDSTPHYFWYSEGSDTCTNKPDDFSGEKITNGQNLYITNTKQPSAQVLIQKVWTDEDGNELAAEDIETSSVTFDLYYSTDSGLSTPEEIKANAAKYELEDNTVTGSTQDLWTKMVSGLPLKDDSGNKYYYYVVENDVPGYTASYTYKVSADTDTLRYEQVVLTNQETPVEYELPHTGGTGTLGYILGGILMMTGSALVMIIRRKRQGGEAS